MKEFNQLCKEFENLDALSYAAVLTQKSAAVLPALAAVTDDGIDGVTIFFGVYLRLGRSRRQSDRGGICGLLPAHPRLFRRRRNLR